MSTARKTEKPWTVERFLEWHAHQDGRRFELIDGYPVEKFKSIGPNHQMMTGASRAHAKISGNISTALKNQLRDSECDAYMHDAAVRVADDQIRYPDIVVDRSTPADLGYEFEDPKIIIEVLSPTTKNFDLTRKLEEYWSVESIRHIVLVDSQAMRVQIISREDDGVRTSSIFEKTGDAIDLKAIGATLKLNDVYAGVVFADSTEERRV